MLEQRHVLLSNAALSGVEYGILRDFEDEVLRLMSAEYVEMPKRKFLPFVGARLEHGTRYSELRKFVPKQNYDLKADVLWVILMGPENYNLDLYKGWDRNVGIKILYLFDAFECHLESIRRVLKSTKWDFTFTAFEGARIYLEEHTQRRWHLVHQGVKLDRFRPPPVEHKVIDFCSYGRQMKRVHTSLKEYCTRTARYYDFNTTAPRLESGVSPGDSYARYAWHLCHSVFNFCWPLNVTHPKRVLTFSPISPRYFEAAASCNVMLGQAPDDVYFDSLFGENAVIPVDYNADDGHLASVWEDLWEKRHALLQSAADRRAQLSAKWSWESRVNEMLSVVAKS